MLAVANTSPLRYMIVIGQSGLLGQLYGTVLIPPGVVRNFRTKAHHRW